MKKVIAMVTLLLLLANCGSNRTATKGGVTYEEQENGRWQKQ